MPTAVKHHTPQHSQSLRQTASGKLSSQLTAWQRCRELLTQQLLRPHGRALPYHLSYHTSPVHRLLSDLSKATLKQRIFSVTDKGLCESPALGRTNCCLWQWHKHCSGCSAVTWPWEALWFPFSHPLNPVQIIFSHDKDWERTKTKPKETRTPQQTVVHCFLLGSSRWRPSGAVCTERLLGGWAQKAPRYKPVFTTRWEAVFACCGPRAALRTEEYCLKVTDKRPQPPQ